jgi:hypothetical protein
MTHAPLPDEAYVLYATRTYTARELGVRYNMSTSAFRRHVKRNRPELVFKTGRPKKTWDYAGMVESLAAGVPKTDLARRYRVSRELIRHRTKALAPELVKSRRKPAYQDF